jgi:hypothetical protein
MKYFFVFVVTFFIFNACASRQYFEPESKEYSADNLVIQNSSYIKSFNTNGATLENNEVITQKGILKTKLPDNYSFLNLSGEYIIGSDNQENIILIGENNQTINLKKNVVAASKENDILALVFADNSMALYNNKTNQYLFRTYEQHSYTNDTRVASPLILNTIILFPTLDGKVVIVDKQSYKIIRTINVDPNNQINNIITLQTIGSVLIVATQNKIIAIQNNQQITKEFFIQNIFINKQSIYIAKLDGTIIKFNTNLEEQTSKKFKFAKFLSLSVDNEDNIYALELGGYLVKISSDFSKTNIYRFIFKDDEKTFSLQNKIYFDNKILFLGK